MAIINSPVNIFYRHPQDLGAGKHNYESDTISIKLISNTPTRDEVNLADSVICANEISGPGYSTGGKTTSVSWVHSISPNNRAVLDLDDVTWAVDANGPQNIAAAVIVNTTSNRAIGFIDLKTGGQPLSLRAGDLTISFNAAGVYDLAF